MVPSRVAGTGVIGILLVGSAYFWSRQPDSAISQTPTDVIVVRGTSAGQAEGGPFRKQNFLPASTRQGVPLVETETANGIVDDAELQASFPDPSLEPSALYKRVRAEPRDVDWAPRSERNITAALTAVPYVNVDDLRVSCASTLCEVRGAMPEGLSIENANVAMEAIQGQKLQSALDSTGLKPALITFGGGARAHARTFTMYTKRQ
jgi:hypothetical protein